MLSGSRSDSGTQNLPAGVRKTIQSIKEIVGNHSYADIYVMLKETNMDPNETTQKLLNQDPFHEVKRKRDKKKQNTSYYGSTESRIRPDTGQGGRSQTFRDRNAWRGSYPRGTLPGNHQGNLSDPISLENIDLTDDWVVEAEDDDAPLLDVNEIDDWMDVADAILDEGEGGAAADEWWRNFGIDDLELQTLAIRILSQTCSSSGCERNWSVFERIHTKRRNRLEHKRLNDLVYTHYNLRLKERQASRKSLTNPISLENIDLTDDWVVEAEDDDAPLLDVDEIDDWMDVADAILDEGEGGAAADARVNQEFRVVRDNRVNQNTNKETKSASHQSPASKGQVISNVLQQSSPGILTDEKHSDASNSGPQISRPHSSGTRDYAPRYARESVSNWTGRQFSSEGPTLRVHGQGARNSQPHSPSVASSNSTSLGVYFSSSDPVHVPSPDSRSNGTVGAIKRAVGIVGVRRQSSEQSAARSSAASSSFSIPPLGKEISTSATSFADALPLTTQFSQPSIHEPVIPGNSASRPPTGNQFNSKQHQQISGHQKASVPNMEWKPKSASPKPNLSSPVVRGTSMAPISSPVSNSASLQEDVAHLPEKVSQMNVSENQHVFIPHHLRVPEADRIRLVFGSFGADFDSLKSFMPGFEEFGDAEESKIEPSASKSIPVEVAAGDASDDQVDVLEGQAGISGSDSPASAAASEHLPQEEEGSSPQDLPNYDNTGLVRNDSPSYDPAEPPPQQDPIHLPSLPDFDSQTGYDAQFFRPAMEENMRGHGLTSTLEANLAHRKTTRTRKEVGDGFMTGCQPDVTPFELSVTPYNWENTLAKAFNSHGANSMPPSTMAMMQPPLYQQPGVHISHFPNYLQYRQFLSPLYVHPMAVPNFSGNPAYPHPSGGNSYVLMPGGSSHLAASGLKYAPTQYKPLTASGYGNYTSPAGYAVSTPTTVGAATGLEDLSRIKYKEGNLFFPNRQAEGSEIWMQTPREIPALHTPPYYNLSGQAPHTAYMSSPSGHTSYNAAQSPHVPFTGLYHPPPPPQAAMATPHHMVHHQQLPGMSGSVGVGVATAPGAQVGPYQQPQLGHLSWTNNF